MSEISSELRTAAAALASHAGGRADLPELLRRAADQLDASDLETVWMWERLQALVQYVESRARRQYGPSQATFLASFAKADQVGHTAWKSGREALLHVESVADRIRDEMLADGTPAVAFKGDWLETVLRAGVDALMQERQAE